MNDIRVRLTDDDIKKFEYILTAYYPYKVPRGLYTDLFKKTIKACIEHPDLYGAILFNDFSQFGGR